MTTWQARVGAVMFWLIALALGIAFAGMYGEYADLRDGEHVTGTVTSVEPHRTYVNAVISYHGRGRDSETHAYPRTADAGAFAVGTPVELLLSSSATIRASKLNGERPSVLFVVGAIAALGIGIAFWLLPRAAAKRRAARREPLDIVIEGVVQTRTTLIAMAIVFTGMAVFIGIAPVMDPDHTAGMMVGLGGLAAVTLGLAVWAGVKAYQLRDPRNNSIVDLIVNHPEDIAWCYVLETRGKLGVTIFDGLIWKTNGKHARIRLVPDDMDAVMAEIARRAPHAARGFDLATEKLYKAEPTRWRPTA